MQPDCLHDAWRRQRHSLSQKAQQQKRRPLLQKGRGVAIQSIVARAASCVYLLYHICTMLWRSPFSSYTLRQPGAALIIGSSQLLSPVTLFTHTVSICGGNQGCSE